MQQGKVFFPHVERISLISICLILLLCGSQVLGAKQQKQQLNRSGKYEESTTEQQRGRNATFEAPAQMQTNGTSRSRNLDDLSNRLDSPRGPAAQQQPVEGDTRVPFWNIAHMINSIGQIELALNAGANGIETDVSFNALGVPIEAYHGFPCDCGRHCHFREQFSRFLRHLAQITNPPATSGLQLVLFDLKLASLKQSAQLEHAGKHLARSLYEQLYSHYQLATGMRSAQIGQRPPLRVIISINHAKDLALVRAFIGQMRQNRWDFMSQQVGFDVGMNDDLGEISSMWDSLNGATSNIWQGDGLTNCANIVRGSDRLKAAIRMRNEQGHFRKIYYWTADILYHIRSVLRLGIDALLTNQPQRVLQALNEAEFKSKYRLATHFDNPFEQFWIEASAMKMPLPTLNEAVETVENLQKTSRNFIKTLPDGIGAALKKVHSTIVRE